MHFFHYNKTLIWKASVLGLLSITFAGLLLIFTIYQESIENVRWSYIRDVQLPTLAYRIHNAAPNNITRNIASVSGAWMGDSQAVSTNQGTISSIPVLVYHGVVEEASEGIDGTNVLVEDFYEHMTALKDAGYTAVTYEDFDQFAKGEIALPNKSVLITFDDGRKDSYYPVDPILKVYNFHATIFVLPRYSLMSGKSGYYLSGRELKKMIASGRWSIQSHSMDAHAYFPVDANGTPSYYYANKLWLEDEARSETNDGFSTRVQNDLMVSKNKLESDLKIEVSGIAYPFGQYGQNTVNNPMAQEVVSKLTQNTYDYAFHQVSPAAGFFYYSPKQGYMVNRIEPRSDWSGSELVAVLEAGKEKEIPFVDTFDTFKGWVKYYGEFSITKTMVLSTSRFNKETFVFLDGAQKWRDYLYSVNVDRKQADTFSLIVNMVNEDNYQSCVFEKGYARVLDRVNEKESMLSEGEITTSPNLVTYAVREKSSSISCLVNNIEVASSSVRTTQGGTIGLKLFGDKINARVDVKGVVVDRVF